MLGIKEGDYTAVVQNEDCKGRSVLCNPQSKQLLYNLLSNVLKTTPPDSSSRKSLLGIHLDQLPKC